MTKLTLDELSIIALYRCEERQETEQTMYAVPVALLETDMQELFRNARRKVRQMTDEEFNALDFRDALIADEDEEEVQ